MSLSLSRSQVHELSKTYDLIPLCLDVMADVDTPVTAYLKLADGPYSFLLESVEGGTHLARYSFIGVNPTNVLRIADGQGRLLDSDGLLESTTGADPLPIIQDRVLNRKAYVDPSLPPLPGGAIGYIGYETVRQWEPTIPPTPGPAPQVPDTVLMFAATIVAFDHFAHRMRIVTHVDMAGGEQVDHAFDTAVATLTGYASRLQLPLRAASYIAPKCTPTRDSVQSNMTEDNYRDAVHKVRDLILGGDVIQVVLSQRFERTTHARPFDIYRALRTVAPTPYMYFLNCDDVQVAGASVETLVKVTNRHMYYHPIAGTRRRGVDYAEDQALEAELRADDKERAEHIMLVDLGRNDVGRVSQTGTVKVTDLMSIERYSNVMHLVSTIEGRLADGLTSLDALRACFPAGTVSGAPKVRAMQILSELENGPRGLYAGAVGYVTFGGDMDTCIAFRTAVIKDGTAYIQAGGGLVADSQPSNEFHETVHKAAAVQRAIDSAERGFDVDLTDETGGKK